MTLIEEGLAAMRGCWRLLRRDLAADEDFNLTIDGFWRSFAMVVPLLVITYPLFLSDHQFRVELAQSGTEPTPLNLGLDYVYLFSGVVIWPIVAATLAWLFGVGAFFVRYMIIYNWMALPATTIALIPHLIHLATGTLMPALVTAQVVFFLLLYVSWYVAKEGLRTTIPIALAFLLAEYGLTYGLNALIR